jgi:hypothetical protein
MRTEAVTRNWHVRRYNFRVGWPDIKCGPDLNPGQYFVSNFIYLFFRNRNNYALTTVIKASTQPAGLKSRHQASNSSLALTTSYPVCFDAFFIFDFQLRRFISTEFWISLRFVVSIECITVSRMKLKWAKWNISGILEWQCSKFWSVFHRNPSWLHYDNQVDNAACDTNHSYPNNYRQLTNIPYKTNAVISNFQACGECSNICSVMVKVLVYWEEEGAVSRYEPHRLKQRGWTVWKWTWFSALVKGPSVTYCIVRFWTFVRHGCCFVSEHIWRKHREMADRLVGIPRNELFSYWRADCLVWQNFVFFPRHFRLETLVKHFYSLHPIHAFAWWI